ncbi:hypothetical protein C8Q80DRAFT_1274013 [Daedaleopsis nitida]|nr:hypothetical protein C8Q80DRAFT_1274013 [Daedaleopsis nitida]
MSKGKERSHEYVPLALVASMPTSEALLARCSNLRILAVSTHITELSYSISDIQTRIFEIQELRHKSQSSNDANSTTTVIDQALVNLDERLETVLKGIKTVDDYLEPLLKRTENTPTVVNPHTEEEAGILRKHATITADWEALQKEIQVLRDELKEDKWLTVFRTVTDQADGMMSSLEKAVNRCQDFMWQVQKRGFDESVTSTNASSLGRADRSPLTYETFVALLESFEAKKKHYMPATSKVLSIIDKGVQDRVTKNGECLRRHAECTQRWRNLRERIARTDTDMDNLRRLFLQGGDSALSSGESSQSAITSVSKNGYLATPPSGEKKGRSPSSGNTISRSISPFRKIARKLKAAGSSTKSPAPGKITPVPSKSPSLSRMPSSEPTRTLRHRSSLFHFLNGGRPPTPTTPDRPTHKYSNSLTPDSSPSRRVDSNPMLKNRPAWNSSTRVEVEERTGTVKQSPRRPSVSRPRTSEDIPPVPPLYKRSLSRSSMASSRPWSPVTSSSTAQSSTTPFSMFRPPSRSQTPAGLPLMTPTITVSPRDRPKTPSHIPGPAKHLRSVSSGQTSPTALAHRALSPTLSISGSMGNFPARPPSRSMIPIPSVHVSSVSRPGTAMSYRSDSAMSFRSSAARAQTPEGILRMTPRPRAPPSSFKDGASPRTPGSRPGSRAGAETPDGFFGEPVHYYVPANHRDPLDMEVANIVNSISHSLLVERVDPPLRTIPKEGEEIRAQYAFSNQLGRKVVTCKLTTMTRSGKGTTRKVMCRVGGGTVPSLFVTN